MAFHYINHSVLSTEISLSVMLSLPSSRGLTKQSHSLVWQVKEICFRSCLATPGIRLDTPKQTFLGLPFTFLFRSSGRMHKDIYSGRDGWCLETTGSAMHCCVYPQPCSESLQSLSMVLVFSTFIILFPSPPLPLFLNRPKQKSVFYNPYYNSRSSRTTSIGEVGQNPLWHLAVVFSFYQ